MGQCMSRKAATALAASAVVVHKDMPKHQKLRESPEDENKPSALKKPGPTKGMATSFGFRRRPTASAASAAGNPTAAKRLAGNASTETITDSNGNTGDTEPLTGNAAASGRSTPHRLPPPKKEAAGTKVSRFGFRHPNSNRMNKIADINTNQPAQFGNNNSEEMEKIEQGIKAKVEMHNRNTMDLNKNRAAVKPLGKFTLQSNQLPRPQPVKYMETKTAKTLANNNRKVLSITHPIPGDESSSMTEDSGIGDNIQQLDRSPIFRRSSRIKPRNLEMVVTGNTFDVRDLDESLENALSLPPLPSAFQRHGSGYVRDRTMEYQRNIDRKRDEVDRIRRNSLTSSEASSHYEEEKPYKQLPKTFLKTRVAENDSQHSSDDQMWSNAGEAMADEFSCSFSSSDESKEKDPATRPTIGAALQTLMAASLTTPKNEIRNVILSIEDPKFAAVAAASNISNLLEDETSPVDSIACSYSETETLHKKCKSPNSSNSKEINEKLTPSSPGSPTNASNSLSLSLSDGREDFLIDDEIADQPALTFDDTITNASQDVSNHNSEATPTLVESTPKPARRRVMGSFEGSPLVLRSKKLLGSRTGSLDTLSPCESIASDDYMMDFELSQSSGVEDTADSFFHRAEQNSQYSLDDVKVRTVELKSNDIMRDWSSLLSSCDKKLSSRPSRLLRSRAGTPSSIPDSPRSTEGGLRSKAAVSQGSLRLSSRSSTGTAGYDSDDSAIRVDRAQHCAMQQDVMSIKTMLLKLKRVLHEPADEDFMLKSETRSSLDNNGFFNGFGSDCDSGKGVGGGGEGDDQEDRDELANLRRQVLFLQGQLEDRERTVSNLQEEMVRLATEQQNSQSAPASVTAQLPTCNAATQTERIRPISAGPSLLQGASADGNPGSLVSASETTTMVVRRSRGASVTPPSSHKQPLNGGKLWRMPGEPPSPQQRFTAAAPTTPTTPPSSIPRRSCSRTRIAQQHQQISSNS